MPLLTTGAGSYPSAAVATITWNPSDKQTDITLSNGNLTAANAFGFDGNFRGVRGTGAGHSTGKYHFELVVDAMNNALDLGMANTSFSLNASGATADMVGWRSTGTLQGGGSGNTVPTWAAGNTLSLAFDLDGKLFWGRVNGGNWNDNGSADPAAGTGGVSMAAMNAGTYFPLMNSIVTATVTANFGGAAYTYTAPSGFGNW